MPQANGSSQDHLPPKTADAQLLITAYPEDDITPRKQTSKQPSHVSLSEDYAAGPGTITQRTSSEYSTTSSSLRSIPSNLRARLNRRIFSWRSNHSDADSVNDPVPSEAGTTTHDQKLIAELDALALSDQERDLLRRMEQVCHSAQAAQHRRHHVRCNFVDDSYQQWSSASDVETEPRLRLRGGGDDADVFRAPRRRTTLPFNDPAPPKADSERPHRVVWWLAGGRKGRVPTYGELRVRKEVEQANRSAVGFWGTVLGWRSVGRVGILPEGEAGVGGEGSGSAMEKNEAGPGPLSRSGSVGSVVSAGVGGGSGCGSLRGEREAEVKHPVEAKAESLISADHSSGHGKVNSSKNTAGSHGKESSESLIDAADDAPEAKAKSARSVVEESRDAGEEDTAEAATAEGLTETAGGDRAKSPKDLDV